MRRLFKVADRYAKESSWQDYALLKICLFSAGIMAGAALPARCKKPVVYSAMGAFVATYVPLMLKFMPYLQEGRKDA